MLIIHPDDGLRVLESVWEYLEDEIPHYFVSGSVSAAAGNPFVGAYLHLLYHHPYLANPATLTKEVARRMRDSRGGGGPSVQSPTSTKSSKPSRQARASAQGGKSGAPRGPRSRGSRHRRKRCPKGHYWSFKQKKCVKSKFR